MEKRRGFRLFQGPKSADTEDGIELRLAADDQGENHQNHLGSHSCNPKVTIAY